MKKCYKHVKSEYSAYKNARQRCNNSSSISYHNYGGRGIQFKFNSFEEFYLEVGEKPEPKEDFSIERIDNNGHYEPGNIRWASRKEQSRNKRNNSFLEYKGRCLCIQDWAKTIGIGHNTINQRLRSGWCMDCVLSPSSKTNMCRHRWEIDIDSIKIDDASKIRNKNDGMNISVQELSKHLDLSTTVINHHIKLGKAGEVEKIGEGRTSKYSLSPKNVYIFLCYLLKNGKTKNIQSLISSYKKYEELITKED